jgi:predicted dehydrogenase
MAFSHEAHKAVIEDFVDAVENGREPQISGASVMAVQRLIDALLESALTQRVITLRSP